MSTIKAYTDISQSKKLAEILPLDSADMRIGNYVGKYACVDGTNVHYYYRNESFGAPEIIPCWSLTALLEFLRNRHDCNYVTLTSNKASLWCLRASYYNHVWEDAEEVSEDAVDACVKMIIKLNELKLL